MSFFLWRKSQLETNFVTGPTYEEVCRPIKFLSDDDTIHCEPTHQSRRCILYGSLF